MQRTPPLNSSSLPSLTIKIYKTLPDASKADLPPKPPVAPITPTSPSPSSFHPPGVLLTSTSNTTTQSRKRTYSNFSNSTFVPLQPPPFTDSVSNAPSKKVKYNGMQQGGLASKTCWVNPASSNNKTNNHKQRVGSGNVHYQRPPRVTKAQAVRVGLQLIHNKLLVGATTLTKKDQHYLAHQIDENPLSIPGMMMKLIAMQVTNKTHDLAGRMMSWATRNQEPELLEKQIVDLLYHFDADEALDEGLMDIKQVDDLMDIQTMLATVRSKFDSNAQTEKNAHSGDVDGNKCESDSGSTDMELEESS
ncbi:hypothetical protein F5B18DRAFT_671578 [Nemania serpens]|nr:hypothetical protein F5B18DRAFT_671578 [Nemania serpens]